MRVKCKYLYSCKTSFLDANLYFYHENPVLKAGFFVYLYFNIKTTILLWDNLNLTFMEVATIQAAVIWVSMLLFSAGTAALSCFLKMTFQKGMIFRKYYSCITFWLWLIPQRRKNRYWSEVKEVLRRSSSPQHHYRIRYKAKYAYRVAKWIYKPIGGCVYCFGTWINIFFFFWMFPGSWLLIFFSVGFNYVFTNIYLKQE